MSRDHSCEACGRGGMNDCQDAELTRLRATVADLNAELTRLRAIEKAAKAWRANSDRVCTKDRSYRWVFEEVLAGRGPKESK